MRVKSEMVQMPFVEGIETNKSWDLIVFLRTNKHWHFSCGIGDLAIQTTYSRERDMTRLR